MDQPKQDRMLRVMKILSSPIDYSLDELADRLEMSRRTIYRYIRTFKDAGFVVTRSCKGAYHLEQVPQSVPDFNELLYFSEEESYLINSLLDALSPTNSLKKGIREKLAVIYDKTAIADFVDRRSNAAHVQSLAEAARGKKKVILKDYESGNSHTIRDRYVEPFAFTTDYIDVCAYDLEDGHNKIFKINRIGSVEVLKESWTAEVSHRRRGMDVFRMTGNTCGHIKLQLSVMAKNLLIEEYPLAEKSIVRETNTWLLDVDVCDFAGACRFYVGLADQIRIIDSPEFEEYVRNYLKKLCSKFNV